MINQKIIKNNDLRKFLKNSKSLKIHKLRKRKRWKMGSKFLSLELKRKKRRFKRKNPKYILKAQ
jgi:hypothetical protein